MSGKARFRLKGWLWRRGKALIGVTVQRCMTEGIVGGQGFAVDASISPTDPSRALDWLPVARLATPTATTTCSTSSTP